MISIQRQLTRKIVGAVVLLLGVGIGALYFAVRHGATEQFDSSLASKAYAVSTLTFSTPTGLRFDFTDRFFRGFEDDKSRDFFQLWDAKGHELARSESLMKDDQLPRQFGKPASPEKWNFTLPNRRPGRAIGFAFKPKSTDPKRPTAQEPDLYLVVASDREDLDESFWELLLLCAGWGIVLVGVTFWLVPQVLKQGLQPLDELGSRAKTVNADSLGTRFEVEGMPNELKPIARQLNELLSRLEESFERERRFSADLAHELRTPLAELRTIAECALKWPESREPTADEDVLAIARQMERLVVHILALTRGDQGQLEVRPESVKIAPLIEEVWSRFSERAEARKLKVYLSIPQVEGTADAALLRSILTNLCENAVDYTAEGGVIEITLAQDGANTVITVANTTNDLQPEDVGKVFDRLWRKEEARTGGNHLGLGLSLSKGFAAAMQWTLSARFVQDRKIAFTLAGATPVDTPVPRGSNVA